MNLRTPTKLIISKSIDSLKLDQLKAALTYTDRTAVYALQRFKRNGGQWYDEEVYTEKVGELSEKTKVNLLFEEEDHYWTHSGFDNKVSRILGESSKLDYEYPKGRLLPWDVKPPFDMHPYQEEAMHKLLEAKHAGVEMGTGLGKSFIIANVVKELGLKTIIMTPGTSITKQLLKNFTKWFGKKFVGGFYGTKKESNKLIVIGNAQSFTLVEKGSTHWKEFQKVQVFIADESHQCPAKTLAKVCFGLAANAPYRFFFSATQMRNDGADLLLEGITGPIVFTMTVREGVDQHYLAKPIFRMFEAETASDFWSQDANEMTRKHLYYNPNVIKTVASLANNAVKAGMSTLILIEEVEQFTKLLPWLENKADFAHGPLNDENRPKVPSEYHDSDPYALVEDFNSGKSNLLVGTSCISTGTDITAVKFLIYWQGGSSEIQVKQAVGRGTRLSTGKTYCHIVDFIVNDQYETASGKAKRGPVGRHAKIRQSIYEDLYGPVRLPETNG